MSTNTECLSLVKRVIQCLREDSAIHGKFCQNQGAADDSREHREYFDKITLFDDLGMRLGVSAPKDTLTFWQEVHRVCELLAEFMKDPEYFSALDLSDDEKLDVRWELRGRREDGNDDFVETKTAWTHGSLKHEFFKLIETTSVNFADHVSLLPREVAETYFQTLSGFGTLFDLELESDEEEEQPWRDPELEYYQY